jgi:hypothetical protein
MPASDRMGISGFFDIVKFPLLFDCYGGFNSLIL